MATVAKRTKVKSSAARHVQAMRIGSEITRTIRQMYFPKVPMITPVEVIRVLNRARVRFVLMGLYGISGWRGEARATEDVDVLVQKSHHDKAVRALHKAFPELVVRHELVVSRFCDPESGRVLIDVMRPLDDLYQVIFRHTTKVGKTHQVPDLEMALATKFAAMVSPNRLAGKKHGDAWDFWEIVLRNYDDIEMQKLWSLGEMVYAGGGNEVLKLVEDAKAGRRLEF